MAIDDKSIGWGAKYCNLALALKIYVSSATDLDRSHHSTPAHILIRILRSLDTLLNDSFTYICADMASSLEDQVISLEAEKAKQAELISELQIFNTQLQKTVATQETALSALFGRVSLTENTSITSISTVDVSTNTSPLAAPGAEAEKSSSLHADTLLSTPPSVLLPNFSSENSSLNSDLEASSLSGGGEEIHSSNSVSTLSPSVREDDDDDELMQTRNSSDDDENSSIDVVEVDSDANGPTISEGDSTDDTRSDNDDDDDGGALAVAEPEIVPLLPPPTHAICTYCEHLGKPAKETWWLTNNIARHKKGCSQIWYAQNKLARKM